MKLKIYNNAAEAAGILSRGGFEDEEIAASVREIVRGVRGGGDEALFAYCKKFDGSDLDKNSLYVTQKEIQEAYDALDPALLSSMKKAAENVFAYHSRNPMREDIRTEGGRTTGYTVRAVERAGIYVPGGTAPLFSSVMMGVLPAKAAGVEHIFVATPAKGGKVHPAVIAAADLCGAERILKAIERLAPIIHFLNIHIWLKESFENSRLSKSPYTLSIAKPAHSAACLIVSG